MVTGLAGLLAGVYGFAFGQRLLVLAQNGWLDPAGLPIGGDFPAFWAAAVLSLRGDAAATFDPVVSQALQQDAIPGSQAKFLWNYPPTFLVVVAPFGLVSAVQAVFAWWALTLPMYLGALQRVVPGWRTTVLALGASGALMTLAHGQNGFLLCAALVVGWSALFDERPLRAGLCFAVVCIKPHFGVLLPFVLAGAGAWRAFAMTGAVAVGWAALTSAVFGSGVWLAFVANLSTIQTGIDGGTYSASKLVSPYVAAATLGLPGAAALQVGVSLACAAGAFVMGRTVGLRPLTAAWVLVATTLSSPYLFDYDLVLLSGAFAFAYIDPSPWGPGERELWAFAAVLPVLVAPLYGGIGVQLAALLGGLLLASLGRRAWQLVHFK